MIIDKQALRKLATDAHELGIIKRYSKGLEAQRKFYAAATPLVIRALLDEMEARDKQVAELVTGRLNLQWILNVYAHAYEEAKEQIAKDVEIKARLCRESNSLFDRLRAAEKRIAELEAKLANPVLLPKTNGYWTEQEKAYEDAITLAKRQVRLAGFSVEDM